MYFSQHRASVCGDVIQYLQCRVSILADFVKLINQFCDDDLSYTTAEQLVFFRQRPKGVAYTSLTEIDSTLAPYVALSCSLYERKNRHSALPLQLF